MKIDFLALAKTTPRLPVSPEIPFSRSSRFESVLVPLISKIAGAVTNTVEFPKPSA